MAASLDRAASFAAVRANPFPNSLTAGQVSGMEAPLDACPPDLPTDHLAYCLATSFLETARTMLPIEEFGRGKGKAYGVADHETGQAYYGRGDVQLTWKTNYARATGELRTRGYLLSDEDLVRTPSLALRHDIAAATLFIGSAAAGSQARNSPTTSGRRSATRSAPAASSTAWTRPR